MAMEKGEQQVGARLEVEGGVEWWEWVGWEDPGGGQMRRTSGGMRLANKEGQGEGSCPMQKRWGRRQPTNKAWTPATR